MINRIAERSFSRSAFVCASSASPACKSNRARALDCNRPVAIGRNRTERRTKRRTETELKWYADHSMILILWASGSIKWVHCELLAIKQIDFDKMRCCNRTIERLIVWQFLQSHCVITPFQPSERLRRRNAAANPSCFKLNSTFSRTIFFSSFLSDF